MQLYAGRKEGTYKVNFSGEFIRCKMQTVLFINLHNYVRQGNSVQYLSDGKSSYCKYVLKSLSTHHFPTMQFGYVL